MKMRSIFLAMLFVSSFFQINQLQASFGDFLYGTCTLIKENQGMIKIAAAIIIPFTGTVYVGYLRRCLRTAAREAKKARIAAEANGKTLTKLVTQVDLLEKTANDTKAQSATNGKTLTELVTQVDLLEKTANDTKTQSVENGQALTGLKSQAEVMSISVKESEARLLERLKKGEELTKEEFSKLKNLLIANNGDIEKLFLLVAGVNLTLEKQVTKQELNNLFEKMKKAREQESRASENRIVSQVLTALSSQTQIVISTVNDASDTRNQYRESNPQPLPQSQQVFGAGGAPASWRSLSNSTGEHKRFHNTLFEEKETSLPVGNLQLTKD